MDLPDRECRPHRPRRRSDERLQLRQALARPRQRVRPMARLKRASRPGARGPRRRSRRFGRSSRPHWRWTSQAGLPVRDLRPVGRPVRAGLTGDHFREVRAVGGEGVDRHMALETNVHCDAVARRRPREADVVLGQGRLVRQDLVSVAPVRVGHPDVGSGPVGGDVRDLGPVGREGRPSPLRDPNRLAAFGVDDEQAHVCVAIAPGGEDHARPVGRDRRAIQVHPVTVQLGLGPIRAEDVEVVGATQAPVVGRIFPLDQQLPTVARPAEQLGE